LPSPRATGSAGRLAVRSAPADYELLTVADNSAAARCIIVNSVHRTRRGRPHSRMGRPALLYEMTNERGRLDCHLVPGLRPPTLRRCRVRVPGLTFSG
jgi:hypothetical protein